MKKRHRFIIPGPLTAGPFVLRDPDLVHQIASVLRLEEGEGVILGDGKGNEAQATVDAVSKTDVRLSVGSVKRNAGEPDRNVTLYCAILKRENFELVVQKAVEVGVSRIVPLRTKRTVKLDVKRERLQKIIQEASEQAGRGIVPELAYAMDVDEALEDVGGSEARYFFDIEGSVDLSTEMKLLKKASRVALFIGPEGGWDPREIEAAKTAGCRIVHLGPLVLRGETAAIIASYRAVHAI